MRQCASTVPQFFFFGIRDRAHLTLQHQQQLVVKFAGNDLVQLAQKD